MVAAILCFFPVMINTARGLLHVEPAALELMRSLAASDTQTFRAVRWPSALPFIFTALKVATTLATIGAVIGEYFGAPSISLGQYIVRYAAYLNLERSWAAISFASAIGIGLYIMVVIVERLVMPWHASYRTTWPRPSRRAVTARRACARSDRPGPRRSLDFGPEEMVGTRPDRRGGGTDEAARGRRRTGARGAGGGRL